MTQNVPGFLSAIVTLKDAPDEPQTFFYRDIMALLAWLFGRLDLAGDMDFLPFKLVDPGDGRLYAEMNTGELWNEVHVSDTLNVCAALPTHRSI